jgi:hypothetical protein
MNTRFARLALAPIAALLFCVLGNVADAQSAPALPTAPGAAQAAVDPTYARASLPGAHGPVEPYLFLFILAGGGIIGVGFATLTDRRLRASAGNVTLQRQIF